MNAVTWIHVQVPRETPLIQNFATPPPGIAIKRPRTCELSQLLAIVENIKISQNWKIFRVNGSREWLLSCSIRTRSEGLHIPAPNLDNRITFFSLAESIRPDIATATG